MNKEDLYNFETMNVYEFAESVSKNRKINIFNLKNNFPSLEDMNDFVLFFNNPINHSVNLLRTLDELLDQDAQREKDGFGRKIKVGSFKIHGRDGEKVTIVPVVEEEKFVHEMDQNEFGGSGQSGKGAEGEEVEEGDVIGEVPLDNFDGEDGEEPGSGDGNGGLHELEDKAYDLGRSLTEKFELPNIEEKGRKYSLTKFSYDLTDRNRRTGQLLDKKETLKNIIKTNCLLGRIDADDPIDTKKMIISPKDKVYRILSKEKEKESEAMVFFIRDYSGSMFGKPTEAIVQQHVYIYGWLMYQYQNQVTSRFILHDDRAKEVEDFNTYYRSGIGGGTTIASAYKLASQIIEEENLEKNYNLYVFQGTDGEDYDPNKESIKELEKLILKCNRVGITFVKNKWLGELGISDFEEKIFGSGIDLEYQDKFRTDSMIEEANDQRIIEGIKTLVSTDPISV